MRSRILCHAKRNNAPIRGPWSVASLESGYFVLDIDGKYALPSRSQSTLLLRKAKRMAAQKGNPMVIPARGGRKLLVLGNEIEIKLGSSDTGGMAFVFENTTPPGDGAPLHVHTREDEMIR